MSFGGTCPLSKAVVVEAVILLLIPGDK